MAKNKVAPFFRTRCIYLKCNIGLLLKLQLINNVHTVSWKRKWVWVTTAVKVNQYSTCSIRLQKCNTMMHIRFLAFFQFKSRSEISPAFFGHTFSTPAFLVLHKSAFSSAAFSVDPTLYKSRWYGRSQGRSHAEGGQAAMPPNRRLSGFFMYIIQ